MDEGAGSDRFGNVRRTSRVRRRGPMETRRPAGGGREGAGTRRDADGSEARSRPKRSPPLAHARVFLAGQARQCQTRWRTRNILAVPPSPLVGKPSSSPACVVVALFPHGHFARYSFRSSFPVFLPVTRSCFSARIFPSRAPRPHFRARRRAGTTDVGKFRPR